MFAGAALAVEAPRLDGSYNLARKLPVLQEEFKEGNEAAHRVHSSSAVGATERKWWSFGALEIWIKKCRIKNLSTYCIAELIMAPRKSLALLRVHCQISDMCPNMVPVVLLVVLQPL